MFCTACGTQKPEGHAQFCANCGASYIAGDAVPAGIAGWSWGAFLLNWAWAIRHRIWVGLFAMIPYVGIGVMIWLGVKGREMAWKNARWESVEQFNRVQRRWSQWGIGMSLLVTLAMVSLLVYAAMDEADDLTPFSQELTDAIASNAESPYTASEKEEDSPVDSDE